MKTSLPDGSDVLQSTDDKPFVASMGIYLFSRRVLLEMLEQQGNDFGRQLIPAALKRYRVAAYLFAGYWADVGTVENFYDANIQLTQPRRAVQLLRRRPARSTPTIASCRRRGCSNATFITGLIAEGSYLDGCDVSDSVVGIRSIDRAAAHRSAARSCSAPTSTRIGPRLTASRSGSATMSRSIAPSSTRTRGSAKAPGWSIPNARRVRR